MDNSNTGDKCLKTDHHLIYDDSHAHLVLTVSAEMYLRSCWRPRTVGKEQGRVKSPINVGSSQPWSTARMISSSLYERDRFRDGLAAAASPSRLEELLGRLMETGVFSPEFRPGKGRTELRLSFIRARLEGTTGGALGDRNSSRFPTYEKAFKCYTKSYFM